MINLYINLQKFLGVLFFNTDSGWGIAIGIFLYISFGFLWISEFFLLYL
jgi:hypothetical protein